jgi:bifunctional DNA-binding transcriptional regulator/antitoxin component of YhaV-PrlF toxin-antitoxin module
MINIQGTAVIRDRGQLTIPEKFRKVLRWSTPNSVVSVIANSGNELVIQPFEGKRQTDWSAICLNIDLSRSYVGKNGNLSSFIATDRENH